MRGRRRERLRVESRTRYKARCPWGADPSRGGADKPRGRHRAKRPLTPAISFPLGPPFCGGQCRAERAVGAGEFFPWGQQADARVRKRRREGNARAAQGTASGRESYTIQTCDPSVSNRCQVGPTILFECPAQIPRSSLRSFSLWARHSAETSAELNVRSVRQNFSLGPAGRCDG